jgi:hypothetical protein
VPASSANNVTESGKKIDRKGIVRFKQFENGYTIFTVGSGDFTFDSKL